MGSRSDESIRRQEESQDGDAAFCRNSLKTCFFSKSRRTCCTLLPIGSIGDVRDANVGCGDAVSAQCCAAVVDVRGSCSASSNRRSRTPRATATVTRGLTQWKTATYSPVTKVRVVRHEINFITFLSTISVLSLAYYRNIGLNVYIGYRTRYTFGVLFLGCTVAIAKCGILLQTE